MTTILMTGVGWKSFVKSTYRQTTNNHDSKEIENGMAFKNSWYIRGGLVAIPNQIAFPVEHGVSNETLLYPER